MWKCEIGTRSMRSGARGAPHAYTWLLGIPANERMDWLVEKATELGVASIQPLFAARSVLRLKGERADQESRATGRRLPSPACEQCGRNRVPVVHPALADLERLARRVCRPRATSRFVLSLARVRATAGAQLLRDSAAGAPVTLSLGGPEGGLSPNTKKPMAIAPRASHRCALGARVLRAETAPLAVLVRSLAFERS